METSIGSESAATGRRRRYSRPEGKRGQIMPRGGRALILQLSSALLLVAVTALGTPHADAAPKAVRLTNTDAQHTAWLRVADSSALEPQQFTFEVWVTPLGPGYGSTNDAYGAVILGKPREGASGYWLGSYGLDWSPVTHKVSFYLVHTYNGQAVSIFSIADILIGQTAHVAVVFDGQEVRLYIDGQLDNSCAFPYQGVYYGAEDILIGAGNFVYPWLRRFDGVLDDVRLWDYPRTGEEIGRDMNCCLSGDEAGLLAWWSFDHDLLIDNSGRGHGAQMNGVAGMAAFAPPSVDIPCIAPYEVSLDPRGTYLRTNDDPSAASCRIVDLLSCGIDPGDTLRIDRGGAFEYHCTPEYPEGTPADPDGLGTICVFSSSNILLSPDNAARVPGAMDAGDDCVTPPTLRGGFPTDIPEDFAVIDSVFVVVPPGAQYLFVGANDEFYGDNCDPNGDYAATVNRKWDCPDVTSSAPGGARGTDRFVGSVKPNPSSSGVTVELLGSGSLRDVKVSVHDAAGRVVRALSVRDVSSGVQQVFWDGADAGGARVSAGVYFVRVAHEHGTNTHRLVIVR